MWRVSGTATLEEMTEPAPQLLPVAAIALVGGVVYAIFAVLAILLG